MLNLNINPAETSAFMIAWPTPKLLVAIVLLLAMMAGVRSCQSQAPEWNPGAVVASEPEQNPTGRGRFSIEVGKDTVQVTPLAEFSLHARVLGTKRYRGSSLEDRLSPVDFALGWQGMSDEQVVGSLDISQSRRWYSYRWRDTPPLPVREMIRSSANMHMVPSSPEVDAALKKVRPGDVVFIRGTLVAFHAQGWRWRSSMTRSDTGDGACELVWVEEVRIQAPPT